MKLKKKIKIKKEKIKKVNGKYISLRERLYPTDPGVSSKDWSPPPLLVHIKNAADAAAHSYQ